MDLSDDSDGEPELDVLKTWKKFVSEKKFADPDKYLTFKDY